MITLSLLVKLLPRLSLFIKPMFIFFTTWGFQVLEHPVCIPKGMGAGLDSLTCDHDVQGVTGGRPLMEGAIERTEAPAGPPMGSCRRTHGEVSMGPPMMAPPREVPAQGHLLNNLNSIFNLNCPWTIHRLGVL